MQFIKYFTILVILAVQYSFQYGSSYRVYTYRNDPSFRKGLFKNYNLEATTSGQDSVLEGTEMSTDSNPYEEEEQNVNEQNEDSSDYGAAFFKRLNEIKKEINEGSEKISENTKKSLDEALANTLLKYY